jgi:hypothetical protein
VILLERLWFYKKIRKKNQWIWSYYDRETLVSNFKYRLKWKNNGETSSACATWSQRSNMTNKALPRGPEAQIICIWFKLSSIHHNSWSVLVVADALLMLEVVGSNPVPASYLFNFSRGDAGKDMKVNFCKET